MSEEKDRKIEDLLLQLLDAVSEQGQDAPKEELVVEEPITKPKNDECEHDEWTAEELARHLRVGPAWVSRHAHEFSGAYQLTSNRGDFRFPVSGVIEWKQQRSAARKRQTA
jgi:hypothetical protein